jgi:hypothetical protein
VPLLLDERSEISCLREKIPTDDDGVHLLLGRDAQEFSIETSIAMQVRRIQEL